MAQRTAFLSKLLGLFCTAYGVMMLVHKDAMLQEVNDAVRSPAALLILGIITLGAGIALVLGHNVWSGGLLPIVVTVVGWLTMLKGFVFVFLTPQGMLAYFAALRYEQLFYIDATIVLVLGLYLVYGGVKLGTNSNE